MQCKTHSWINTTPQRKLSCKKPTGLKIEDGSLLVWTGGPTYNCLGSTYSSGYETTLLPKQTLSPTHTRVEYHSRWRPSLTPLYRVCFLFSPGKQHNTHTTYILNTPSTTTHCAQNTLHNVNWRNDWINYSLYFNVSLIDVMSLPSIK